MSDERVTTQNKSPHMGAKAGGAKAGGAKAGRFLGSLKDALAAASRDDTQHGMKAPPAAEAAIKGKEATQPAPAPGEAPLKETAAAGLSAAEAAREIKAQTSLGPQGKKQVEFGAPPTTRVVRGGGQQQTEEAPRTKLVRGKVEVKRGAFQQDPVVAWLVIVGGPGIGSYRPIFEGNNTIGRSSSQRIPIDFGDETISSEEQAYIRYDSSARSFLFVPNLAKTNVVSLNNKRPTGAVELSQMDVITMGRTQLVFVPFCGADFDWAELTDAND
jgi:hypothetical protein